MLKIKRIITNNSFSYSNIKFMDFAEDQYAIGIKKYITDELLEQIVIHTDDDKIKVLPDWMVGVLEVRMMKPPFGAERISQLTLTGELSYGPAFLIEMKDYKKLKIPKIFRHQLSFVSDNHLHICHQKALVEITK